MLRCEILLGHLCVVVCSVTAVVVVVIAGDVRVKRSGSNSGSCRTRSQ